MEKAADALFDLMGVEYAKEGKKSTSFGTSVSALGLVFDLTEFSKGNVTIRHTERRAQELRGDVGAPPGSRDIVAQGGGSASRPVCTGTARIFLGEDPQSL